MKFLDGFKIITNKMIAYIFAFAMALIWCLQVVCTCYLDRVEKVYFVNDSILVNVISIFFSCVILFGLYRNKWLQEKREIINQDIDKYRKFRKILLLILGIISIMIVLCTQIEASADQFGVQDAVYKMHLKDYSEFGVTGYIGAYHNQVGLVFISYLLSVIWGSGNYIAFQIVNCFAHVLCVYELTELAEDFHFTNFQKLLVCALAIVFIPQTLYCTFVYGNILGLSFALVAYNMIYRYISDDKPQGWLKLIFAGLCMAISLLVRNNYIIFLIALLIGTIGALDKKKYKRILSVWIILITLCLIQSIALTTMVRHVTGEKFDQGMSPLAHIAMGLQEGERGPGWYNSYNRLSYEASGYNKQVNGQIAFEDINRSIEDFVDNPKYGIQFFTRKIASQWCNPDFESLWLIKQSMIKESDWFYWLSTLNGAYRLNVIFNIGTMLYCFGALLSAIFGLKKDGLSVRILALTFIGGFMFHAMWEAKAQYTITYAMILMPFTIDGYSKLLEYGVEIYELFRSKGRAGESIGANISALMKERYIEPIIVGGISIVLFAFVYILSGNELTKDTEAYEACLAYDNRCIVADGVYTLQSVDGKRKASYLDTFKLVEDTVGQEPVDVFVYNYHGKSFIRLAQDKYLTQSYGTIWNGENVSTIAFDPLDFSKPQLWDFVDIGENRVFIRFMDSVFLTYDDISGDLYLTDFTGEENQRFVFVEKKE